MNRNSVVCNFVDFSFSFIPKEAKITHLLTEPDVKRFLSLCVRLETRLTQGHNGILQYRQVGLSFLMDSREIKDEEYVCIPKKKMSQVNSLKFSENVVHFQCTVF